MPVSGLVKSKINQQTKVQVKTEKVTERQYVLPSFKVIQKGKQLILAERGSR